MVKSAAECRRARRESAPPFERARVLSLAIHEASRTLKEPIETVSVQDDLVVCQAKNRQVIMTMAYANALPETGLPHPRGCKWIVAKKDIRDVQLSFFRRWLLRWQR
jgi:hypothetical protein